MNNLVKINNHDIQIKEFNGQRVVTLKDIDFLHQRPDGTARRNFNENKIHFIADEDYFVRNMHEAKEEFGVIAPNGLILLTESGYLMIVKSLQDDLAWTVQRQLVNGYFRAKNNQPIGLLESLQSELNNTKQELEELKQVVYSDQRRKLTKKERQLGISTPMSERIALVPDEEILEIIKIALENGLLRELDEGIAVDKRIMLEEAEERNIAKSILNKKLLLMGIVIPDKNNHAYKQVRKEGAARWCYVIKTAVNE